MRLRYMIDMILRQGEGGQTAYEPVGVWVQGPGPGLDIEMSYLDGRNPAILARKREADWVINRLVEADMAHLPDDVLEYHRQSRSPYDGAFSEIIETSRFETAEACIGAVIKNISKIMRPGSDSF